MDNQQKLQHCKDRVEELKFLVHFDYEHDLTHGQRNAVMQLIRVVTEELDKDLLYLKVDPTPADPNEIPF